MERTQFRAVETELNAMKPVPDHSLHDRLVYHLVPGGLQLYM